LREVPTLQVTGAAEWAQAAVALGSRSKAKVCPRLSGTQLEDAHVRLIHE